jgi:predicted TIM-barrel fold metal-dependent hydrolase
MANDTQWIISVDDHVIEPGHVWQTWVPSKQRDAAPKLVRDDAGDAWVYDGKRQPLTGLSAVAGTPKDTWSPAPLDFARLDPMYCDPKARAKAMDRDGVIAALLFPSFPRFCGQTFLEASDKDVALVCVQAYNDWMVREWSAAAPGRFIPLGLIPLWDADLAAAEVRRAAAMGVKSIAFSENPSKLGLPSIHDADRYWDPLFAACAETGLPLSIHIGSSSALMKTADDSPLIVSLSLSPMNAIVTLIDWLHSGVLLRFPDLNLSLAEGGIGWLPWAIERVRRDVDRQQWARSGDFTGNILTGDMRQSGSAFGDTPTFDPFEVFQKQVYGCMLADDYGWEALSYLGYDNVMVETDFPHSDSSFPNSAELANKHLAGLSEEDRHKVLVGNACRVFNFTPAEVPA